LAGIYLLTINHFVDYAKRGTNLEQDSHFSVVVDDARIVHAELNISTLEHFFVVDSVAQLSGEHSSFRHLLRAVEEKNEVRFSGLDDNEPGQL
jgi:hypothetical protein